MQVRVIEFIKQGKIQHIVAKDSHQSLLSVLREQMRCTGTKEGCAEGDCGACTVVVAELAPSGAADSEANPSPSSAKIQFKAVNSCIQAAHSIHGKALWTVEDLHSDPLLQKESSYTSSLSQSIALHPVQSAMVECHASQCGFCTPGFVMSLFARFQNQRLHPEKKTNSIQETLSGNLCRCTGYQSIDQAAQTVDLTRLPSRQEGVVDTDRLLPLLQQLELSVQNQVKNSKQKPLPTHEENAYYLPQSLDELLKLRQQLPHAQLLAGGTDVGLWINKRMMRFPQIIDLTQVRELKKIEIYPHHLAIGASVDLNSSFEALSKQRPQLKAFFDRFAGFPVRNAGTIGGNIGNGSPIGDSMPVLIALGANLVLSRKNGKTIDHREIALENLYTGYRSTILQPDEIITWIKVPSPLAQQKMQAYKISKRQEDDISAVCLAIEIEVKQQIIVKASLGLGGVAATPVRALKTQAFLTGKTWSLETILAAGQVLQAELNPISDMRASSQYRRHLLGTLLHRFWLEEQGTTLTDLEKI